MYLEHFKLNKAPFSLTPNTEFYCELPTHQEAINVLLLSLKQGEGFIKIIGEVGTGKTLLCRLLLNSLASNFFTAYIPNPDTDPDGLRLSVAHELGLDTSGCKTQYEIIESIQHRLLQLHHEGKQVVLMIDESQALSFECLEAVRLLTNLETEEQKLLQVVLFAQPELDVKLNQNRLRQLKQRITFSYYLQPLAKNQLEAYLCHRLSKAGYTYGSMFSRSAQRLLYKASGGLPRILNILCHKALLVAYGQGDDTVRRKAIKRAIADTDSVPSRTTMGLKGKLLFYTLSSCAVGAFITLFFMLGLFDR